MDVSRSAQESGRKWRAPLAARTLCSARSWQQTCQHDVGTLKGPLGSIDELQIDDVDLFVDSLFSSFWGLIEVC